MHAVLLAGALLIGCLLAVQASANLQLTRAVGTPYGASTLQLWCAVGCSPGWPSPRGRWVPWVVSSTCPAGTCSAGWRDPAVPRTGALAAGGLFVTGRMAASIALDLLGLFGLSRQPVGVGIVAGSLALLAGITIIIRGQRPVLVPAAAGPAAPEPPAPGRVGAGWVLLGLVAGAVLPVQGAINARLRGALEQPAAVALTSFGVLPRRPFTATRGAGLALLVAGSVLVQLF